MRGLNSLPKNVRYQRQSLDDAKNAMASFRKAIAVLPREPEPETASSYLLYGPEDAGAVEPTESDYAALATWCQAGKASLEAVDAGLRCDALQFPATDGFGAGWASVLELIAGLLKVSHLLAIKAKLLERNGDMDMSTRELLKLYRMGQLICNGDGLIVCYLAGSGIRSRALNQLQVAVQSKQLTSTTARVAQEELLRATRSEEGLAQAHRIELIHFSIPTVERIPETDHYEQLIDYLVEQHYETSLFSDMDDSAVKVSQPIRDERQALRKRQLNQLLAGHPKAFDREETIRILVQVISRYIGWLDFVMRSPNSRWRHRVRDMAAKWSRIESLIDTDGAWPESLAPSFPFELFGEDEAAEAARKKFSYTADGEFPPAWRPLSPSNLANCNQLLRRVANPVGKILAAQQMTMDASQLCFEHYRLLNSTIQALARQI